MVWGRGRVILFYFSPLSLSLYFTTTNLYTNRVVRFVALFFLRKRLSNFFFPPRA